MADIADFPVPHWFRTNGDDGGGSQSARKYRYAAAESSAAERLRRGFPQLLEHRRVSAARAGYFRKHGHLQYSRAGPVSGQSRLIASVPDSRARETGNSRGGV